MALHIITFRRTLRQLLMVMLIGLFSCDKLVTVPAPVNLLTQDVVFNNDQSAGAAISGLYSSMMQTNLNFASAALTVYPALTADELYPSGTGNYLEFSKNAITASNSVVGASIWATAYNYIYQSNAIIEGLSKSATVSAPVKKQLTGEALFIRAFSHFYLVNIFGNVPLVTTTAAGVNAVAARATTDLVYTQIINDLLKADSLLPVSVSPGRPGKWAALSLLARVQLFTKNYAAAKTTADEILSQSGIGLESDLSKVFLATSKEAIWQLVPISSTINTYEGNLFIPGTNEIPPFALTSFLLNAFEPGDNRKDAWLGNTTINNTTYYYPFKYKVKTSAALKEYYIVMRLAEIYLISAEANVQLNNLAAAKTDLNIIRNRAGLSNTTANNAADLLLAIQKERQTELFCEWGHRWFDLKRTNQADSILGQEKAPDWQSSDALYPIPSAQIKLNPLLTQNTGY